MQKFRQTLRFSRGYVPNQQVAGEANESIFAGENVVFKGNGSSIYAEAYKGTLTRAANTPTESAYFCLGAPSTGKFVGAVKNETEVTYPGDVDDRFVVGQQLRIGGKHYYITRIARHGSLGNSIGITPPFMDASIPITSGGYEVFVLPVLCVVNDKLGLTYGAGNLMQLPKGNMLTTGVMGVTQAFLISRPGGAFSEPPLTENTGPLSGKPALLPLTTPPTIPPSSPPLGPWQELTLGLTQPTIVSLAAIPGTGKNMPAGRYSVRICRSRLETVGYGNPSEAVEVVLKQGDRIEVELPPVSTVYYNPPVDKTIPNQNAWRIFVTLYAVQEAISGPWYELVEIPESEVGVSRKVQIEWRDYEVAGSQLVTFDNDPPPPARFVVMFGGLPVLLSCLGIPTVPGEDRAPGPSIQPSKTYNIEGFPRAASLAVGPVQDIVSFVEGEGRLYVLTPNYLHVVTLTGNPDQPLTVRPFAQTSILRHNQLIYVGGVLYAFTARGPARFSGEGMAAEDNVFATPVKSITDTWNPGKVLVVHDPLNEAILYIHSQDSPDPVPTGPNAGKLRTMVLSYYLTLGIWSTPIWISVEGEDTYVSGAATMGGRTYFLVGGGSGAPGSARLQQWDGLTGGFIPWYMATPYIDQGAEAIEKNVRFLSVTHRGQFSRAAVYGAEVDLPITDLMTPNVNGALTEEIALPRPGGSTPSDNTDPNTNRLISTHTERLNVRNLRLYAVKVLGVSTRNLDPAVSVHTEPDRVDEIVVAGNIHGPTN